MKKKILKRLCTRNYVIYSTKREGNNFLGSGL